MIGMAILALLTLSLITYSSKTGFTFLKDWLIDSSEGDASLAFRSNKMKRAKTANLLAVHPTVVSFLFKGIKA